MSRVNALTYLSDFALEKTGCIIALCASVPLLVALCGACLGAHLCTVFLSSSSSSSSSSSFSSGQPFGCALLQNLYFNNFKCESRGSANATNATVGSTGQQSQYKAIINGTTPTTSLYLEYTPIDYLNLPLNTPPFTQFLVR